MKAGPPALPCRDDVLIDNGAAAPKLCLSPLEMRPPTVAGGLLPIGKTSTATMTILRQLSLWFCSAEETNLRTSVQYASYNNIFWRINNQQAPFWSRVIKPKSGQNLLFGSGGSTGCLRACPFLGTWRALLCGEVYVRALDEAEAFFRGWMTLESSTCRSGAGGSFTPCVLRSIAVSPQPSCSENVVLSTTA